MGNRLPTRAQKAQRNQSMLTNAQEHLVNNKVGDIFSYISIFFYEYLHCFKKTIFFYKKKYMRPWPGNSVG